MKNSGELMWPASSRRFWSFQAGSVLWKTPGVSGAPYQPTPNPSPLVGLGPEPRMQALVDERVGPLVERLLHEDRGTGVCEPAAHGPLLSVVTSCVFTRLAVPSRPSSESRCGRKAVVTTSTTRPIIRSLDRHPSRFLRGNHTRSQLPSSDQSPEPDDSGRLAQAEIALATVPGATPRATAAQIVGADRDVFRGYAPGVAFSGGASAIRRS